MCSATDYPKLVVSGIGRRRASIVLIAQRRTVCPIRGVSASARRR
jgi:hypothetical protein